MVVRLLKNYLFHTQQYDGRLCGTGIQITAGQFYHLRLYINIKSQEKLAKPLIQALKVAIDFFWLPL